MDIQESMCCGVDEFHGLNDEWSGPKAILVEMGFDRLDRCCFDNDAARQLDRGVTPGFAAHMVFTEARSGQRRGEHHTYRHNHGTRLMRYISRMRLGQITASPWSENPNSKCDVRTITWTINHERFTAWLKEQKRYAEALEEETNPPENPWSRPYTDDERYYGRGW